MAKEGFHGSEAVMGTSQLRSAPPNGNVGGWVLLLGFITDYIGILVVPNHPVP